MIPYWNVTFCFRILLGLLVAPLLMRCDFADESQKEACLYYFSWANVYGGLGLQFVVSVAVPFWLLLMEMACYD